MSTERIPAKDLLTCDRCGAKGEQFKEGPFHNGGLHSQKVEIWNRSYNGNTGGGGATRELDLCSDCAGEFNLWLKGRWQVGK